MLAVMDPATFSVPVTNSLVVVTEFETTRFAKG